LFHFPYDFSKVSQELEVVFEPFECQRTAQVEAVKVDTVMFYACFEAQSESMQDVILDLVEMKSEDNSSLLLALRKDRKTGNLKIFQIKSASKFKEAMQENGLI
jgi:predicted CopG family antitoxin